MLDIHTVGAGGGSIAWIDSGGSLRVGPRSAGADPGPACYGTGTELTVTDANLLLGRLDPAYFLGGRMALDLARPRKVAKQLAKQLGLSVIALAEGIVRIANTNMENAIRVVICATRPRPDETSPSWPSVAQAACTPATSPTSLDIKTVLIPEHCGVLSALGMLLADVVKGLLHSQYSSPPPRSPKTSCISSFKPLIDRAVADIQSEGFSANDIVIERALDMRYKGQAYEITVPFRNRLRSRVQSPTSAILRILGPSPSNRDRSPPREINRPHSQTKSAKPRSNPSRTTIPRPPCEQRVLHASPSRTPIYHRELLFAGMQGQGPALIVSGQSTTIIPPHFDLAIDGVGTLIATRREPHNKKPR